MSQSDRYRYVFSTAVPFDGVVDAMLLARWGAEALHGETPARLEVDHKIDRDHRACEIDAASPVGRDFNRLFAGYVTREYGPDGFVVERLASPTRPDGDRPEHPGVTAATGLGGGGRRKREVPGGLGQTYPERQ